MSSLNSVTIIGNLGQDPDTRYAPDGTAIVNISVATSRKWTEKASGELKEETEWHRVAVFGRQAEVADQYLKKGRKVCIQGRLRTRKWQDKQGNDRYTTEIVCENLVLIDSARTAPDDGGDNHQGPTRRQPAQRESNGHQKTAFDDMDDDIPF